MPVKNGFGRTDTIKEHIAELEKTIAKLSQHIKGIDKKAEPPAPRKNNGLSGDDAA